MSDGADERLDEAAAALRAMDDGTDGEATLARVLRTLARRDALGDLLEEATSAYAAEVCGDEDDLDLAEATLARIRSTSGAVVEEPSTSIAPAAVESEAATGSAHPREVGQRRSSSESTRGSRQRWTTWPAAAAALLVIGLGVPTTWAWATGQLPAWMARVGLTERPPASDSASGDPALGRAVVAAPPPADDDHAQLAAARASAGASGAGSTAPASGSIAPPAAGPASADSSAMRPSALPADPSGRRGPSGEDSVAPANRRARSGASGQRAEDVGRTAWPSTAPFTEPTYPTDPTDPTAAARRPASMPANAPTDEVEGEDPETRAFAAAHRAHFDGGRPAVALSAWDAYLAAHPRGRYEIEARYNRALCLVRLGRLRAARDALRPFADGRHGGYREADARALVDALTERLASER